MADTEFVETIQSEIEKVSEDLKDVDECLKKLTGRDFADENKHIKCSILSPELHREEGGSNSDSSKSCLSFVTEDDDGLCTQRRTGEVFKRLGKPVNCQSPERRTMEVVSSEIDDQDSDPKFKATISSSIVARPNPDAQDIKSRTEVVAELTKDRASMGRNRRMFGALLGTLKRFRNEEEHQKSKEDKRAKIEKKVEQRGLAEKENLRREREELLQQRRERQYIIQKLNLKMDEFKKHKNYENYQRKLCFFIRTKAKPQVFWMPKKSDTETSRMISNTSNSIEEEIKTRREELRKDLEVLLSEKAKRRVSTEVDEEAGSQLHKNCKSNSIDIEEELDHSDYDADANHLLYEDALMFSGKNNEGRGLKNHRVVVQVNSSVNESVSERKVEIVTMKNRQRREVKVPERLCELVHRKSKISVARNNGKEVEVDSGVDNEETVKKRSNAEKKKRKKKERKHLAKEQRKHKRTKKILKNRFNELPHPSSSENESEETEEDFELKATVDQNKSKTDCKSETLREAEASRHPISNKELPSVTEVVVQHVPVADFENNAYDNHNMQVQTLLIDAVNIKKDLDDASCNSTRLPMNFVIKKEKDLSTEPIIKDPGISKSSENPKNVDKNYSNKTNPQTDSKEKSSDSDSDQEPSDSSELDDKNRGKQRKTSIMSSPISSNSDSSNASSDSENISDESPTKKIITKNHLSFKTRNRRKDDIESPAPSRTRNRCSKTKSKKSSRR